MEEETGALINSLKWDESVGKWREARTKGGKRTLGIGHQDARMQCLTQVVFPIWVAERCIKTEPFHENHKNYTNARDRRGCGYEGGGGPEEP